jgi:hypothetical protein
MATSKAQRARWASRHAACLFALLVALGASSLFGACRAAPASTGGVQVDLRVTTQKTVGPASVEVTLRDSSGAPVDGAQVTLKGDMSHAGMQAVIVPMKAGSGGSYISDGFKFTMAGDWILTVQAVLPSGDRVEKVFDVTGVAGG